ncbi:MAG: hypothetical protein JNM86_02575 [Phycisphaerae bacterium]|nr:hypothetical protein [Phycisphaerae bacterium]
MTTDLHSLKIKAVQTVFSIKEFSPSEREYRPSIEFAREYNRFRNMVAAAYPPGVNLLPPTVEVPESGSSPLSACSYGEFMIYYNQMIGLLARWSSEVERR